MAGARNDKRRVVSRGEAQARTAKVAARTTGGSEPAAGQGAHSCAWT
jgi:hypothetical protein